MHQNYSSHESPYSSEYNTSSESLNKSSDSEYTDDKLDYHTQCHCLELWQDLENAISNSQTLAKQYVLKRHLDAKKNEFEGISQIQYPMHCY